MKWTLLSLVLALFGILAFAVRPALAQTETPPVRPMGEIRGSVINTNSGKVVAESMEVMLHILNKDYVDMDMVHAQSQPDGTFVFTDVPFAADLQFAVMATFDGVTYFSNTVPADMEALSISIDVPVYETTKDPASLQVDQMHVLFELSPDGLETKELYTISNTGDRTVKDVIDLGEDTFATLEFPLPPDADYVFFKPDDKDRFFNKKDGFADLYPILAGGQPTQIMVSYLVPFSGERTYSFTPPLNIVRLSLVVPEDSGLSLAGTGLTRPESVTLQDGLQYQVYAYSDLKAGQTLNVTFTGSPMSPVSASKGSNNLLAFGAALLGSAVMGAGVRWWRRSVNEPEEDAPLAGEPTFDELITEIALLDENYEQRGLGVTEYQDQRAELLQRAKHISS